MQYHKLSSFVFLIFTYPLLMVNNLAMFQEGENVYKNNIIKIILKITSDLPKIS